MRRTTELNARIDPVAENDYHISRRNKQIYLNITQFSGGQDDGYYS